MKQIEENADHWRKMKSDHRELMAKSRGRVPRKLPPRIKKWIKSEEILVGDMIDVKNMGLSVVVEIKEREVHETELLMRLIGQRVNWPEDCDLAIVMVYDNKKFERHFDYDQSITAPVFRNGEKIN